ncbi:dienelactone hydrolase [Constrictibacter sp. MBR-5]|uniref:dienelactone hydrolase family protein n=1 Tax=Constrictibacter sp. MBR-5 TaxID=3156467 RepID=UPI0033929992
MTFELEPRLVRSFRSDGKLVRVDVIRAVGAGSSRPAVVMLHGASGLGSGWLVFPHAEELARRGIDAFVVRYYDGLDGNDGSKSSSALHYRREQIISDAISYIASIPEIDPQRIGVYGMSLGAFHALALGTHDRRVAAIADVMGAMPGQIALSSVTSMPPTLLIHGARDRIVPIERMYEVASRLDDIGASYEVKVYTDQAHNLAGAAHTDSILTVADFFDRRLNGAAQTASAQVPASARTLTSLSEIKPVITARTQSKSTKTALNSRSKKGAKDVRVTAKSSATKVAGKPRETPAKVATAPIRSTTKASGQSASSANAARGAKDTKSRQAAVSRPEPQPAATRTKTPVDRNQVAATR